MGSSNTPPNKRRRRLDIYCSIDWLSITTKHNRGAITPKSLTKSYLEKKGRLGYKESKVYDNGITHLWSEDRPEIHVIYSGATLKSVSEIMPIQRLVQWHQDLGHRVSRIDTAIDVFDSEVTVTEFAEEWAKNNVKTRAKTALLISDPKGETGDTFYVGSLKKRRKLLRIYDKAREQKVDKDWIRFEMQWGAGAARSSALQIAECDQLDDVIKSQFLGYCDFKNRVWKRVFYDSTPIKVSHDMPQGVTGRLQWIYDCVLPALTEQEKETPGLARLLSEMVSENLVRQGQRDRKFV